MVDDEIAYLDIGFSRERHYFDYQLTRLALSYSDDWENYYKIAGFTVFNDLD